MIDLKNKSSQEKYFNSIVIYSHRIKGLEREQYITELSNYNPLLAAKCIMQCEGNERVEKYIASKAELCARSYEDIAMSANGYLALIELNNLNGFKNVLLDLDHSSLKYLTFVFKQLVNAIDAGQILTIADSIVDIESFKTGIKPKLLLDIMKFIIIGNIHFEKYQIDKLISIYSKINNTLRLSQLTSFLKCSKKDAIDFLVSKGVYLKLEENPKVKYMLLAYFVGQFKFIDKNKISFAEKFPEDKIEIPVTKSAMSSIITSLSHQLKVGETYSKSQITSIILDNFQDSNLRNNSSFIATLKRLKVITFEKLELDKEGVQRSHYKILSFPDISLLNLKEPEINKKAYTEVRKLKEEFIRPIKAQKKEHIKKPKERVSDLGEKLTAALNNGKKKYNSN